MKPKPQKIIANKESILKEAELLFAKNGFKATSIRDLAASTGLSHGAIYYHFKNKEDLFLKLIEIKLKELTPAMKKAANSKGTVRQRLTKLLTTYFSWEPDKRHMIEQGFLDIMQIEDAEIQTTIERWTLEYRAITENVLKDGIKNGELKNIDTALLYEAFAGLSQGALRNLKGSKPDELANCIIELFYDGIKKETNEK